MKNNLKEELTWWNEVKNSTSAHQMGFCYSFGLKSSTNLSKPIANNNSLNNNSSSNNSSNASSTLASTSSPKKISNPLLNFSSTSNGNSSNYSSKPLLNAFSNSSTFSSSSSSNGNSSVSFSTNSNTTVIDLVDDPYSMDNIDIEDLCNQVDLAEKNYRASVSSSPIIERKNSQSEPQVPMYSISPSAFEEEDFFSEPATMKTKPKQIDLSSSSPSPLSTLSSKKQETYDDFYDNSEDFPINTISKSTSSFSSSFKAPSSTLSSISTFTSSSSSNSSSLKTPLSVPSISSSSSNSSEDSLKPLSNEEKLKFQQIRDQIMEIQDKIIMAFETNADAEYIKALKEKK